jgi:uncharacterized protein (UPF0261 family)
MATVLVIGTFDTKGPESHYLRERIEAHGCKTLALDSGILGEAEGIKPDFTRQMVAEAGGHTIDQLRNAGSRGKAVERMLVGVRKLAQQLYAEKKIHGLVSLGGAEGAVLASAAMRHLPVGIPKLIVSPLASGRRTFDPFIGTKDVFVMHSVVDILGLNVVSCPIFDTVAASIAGMAKAYELRDDKERVRLLGGRKQIAATMLGNTTRPLMWIKKQIEPQGYDIVIFHANGVGGPAMEELVEENLFHGILDYTLSELAGEVAGGYHNGGPRRMETAGLRGIPQLIVPGCVDFIACGSHDIAAHLKNRPSHYHNPEFTLIRLTRDEQLQVARNMARKLNAAKGKVHITVPTRGLSIPNIEKDQNGKHGEFWDPETDRLFREELKRDLSPKIGYEEVDAHISDAEFAKVILGRAVELFG